MFGKNHPVRTHLSTASMYAPCSSSKDTTSVWPFSDAKWRAVPPSCIGETNDDTLNWKSILDENIMKQMELSCQQDTSPSRIFDREREKTKITHTLTQHHLQIEFMYTSRIFNEDLKKKSMYNIACITG